MCASWRLACFICNKVKTRDIVVKHVRTHASLGHWLTPTWLRTTVLNVRVVGKYLQLKMSKDSIQSAVNGEVQSDVKLDGKTVVITGANQGIGFETALDLAGRGAKVIMACRDIQKAEEAKSKIIGLIPNANLVILKLDLASLDSVRECAKMINESEPQLDILINNAGIMCCPKWKTVDGYEMHLGVNHIGHFLFTNLLLDLIKKSAPSRIVMVSSGLYKRGKMHWEDMMHDKEYLPFGVYSDSKLANIHHCLELSRRLQGTGVTCNCLHPGVVKTNLGQHMRGSHIPFFRRMMMALAWPIALAFFLTPKQGAQTSIYCAIAPELQDVTGKYFGKCAEEQLMEHALVQEDAEKLWKLSEEWVEKKENAVTEGTSSEQPSSQ